MEIIIKNNREHNLRLRVEKNKAIILRNVWFEGDLYLASVCSIYRDSLLHRADKKGGRIWE